MGHTFHPSDSGRNEGNKSGAQLERILDLGGFVSLGMNGGGRLQTQDFSSGDGVAFNCGRSSQAFAQQYPLRPNPRHDRRRHRQRHQRLCRIGRAALRVEGV